MFKRILARLFSTGEGIQHAEEALLLALVALGGLVGYTLVADGVNTAFETAIQKLLDAIG